MVEKLKHRVPHVGGVRALIRTATTDILIGLLVGGDNMESQLERLAQKPPDAIIATPDTLIHHLSVVDLHTVELFVIDGAYDILHLGFTDQILGQRDPKVVQPSKIAKKVKALNLSLLSLGNEQRQLPNNLQSPPSPTQCSDVNARSKKGDVNDGMEEARGFKRTAEELSS